MTCIYPKCGKTALSRGLCRHHYMALAAAIRNGPYTWSQMEQDGKCLPATVKKHRWFFEKADWYYEI